MLINILAFAVAAHSQPSLYCPSTLEEIKGAPVVTMEYAGAKFGTCCGGGCAAAFEKDPQGLIAKAIAAKKTVGVFDYDPISGWRIDPAKGVAFSDYKAIRYWFASTDEKKKFDQAPGRYIKDVKSESYYCPIMDQPTTSDNAASFGDYKGVRYFMCCTICVKKLRENPEKYMPEVKDVKPLKVEVVKKG